MLKTKEKYVIPKHLSKQARAFYKYVAENFCLEQHHHKLLLLASETWDLCQQSRAIIEKEGLTFYDRFDQLRPRPETKILNDSKITFARLLRELRLDIEPEDSRPPRFGV